jgi:predicted amidohydrolase
MRAACLQQQVEPCKTEENLSRALQMASAALAEGAEILVFPELFLTGFCYEPSFQSSPFAQDHPPYPSLDPFRALAQEHDCLIIGSLRSGQQNLGFCLDGEGLQLRPKIHPFGEEKEHFDGGDFITPVATKWGRVGLEICYDLRFPEVARSLALQGADFLVTVAQFPALRREQWRALCLARAIENQMPHLACNWARGGGSLIIDARGQGLAEAGSEETLILADIDLADRDAFRREVSCFADRRPEIYGGWEAERSNL